MACFCKYCRRVASDSGLDLEAARRQIAACLTDADCAKDFTRSLFTLSEDSLLESFFQFRSNSITHIIQYASKLARSQGLHIGLDCFSPALTRMVGQDLAALDKHCDWIKLMIYPRVFGPAGLPFEWKALSEWLEGRYNVRETEAAEVVGKASGLKFSATGLDSNSLAHEIRRGRKEGVTNLFAGLALVELEGVHHLTVEQAGADLAVCHSMEVDGLMLSWDLWHIPHKYIASVSDFVTQ
jgi:hypothetical protein